MIPINVVVHQKSRVLELSYEGGKIFRLPFEYLRVSSPSAEVRGHGPGQETLQTGKRDILIVEFEPVGHYAIKPTFSDGHDSGLYSWDYLFSLGENQEKFWNEYLEKLNVAGIDRDDPMIKQGHSCGNHH